MAATKSQEVEDLVWRGHLQIGDEPGIYGDADYAGLTVEFPVELLPFDPRSATGEVVVVLELDEVKVYDGFAGHPVVVVGYFPDPTHEQRWTERELASARIKGSGYVRVELPLKGEIPRYVSIRVRTDTSIPPGLYDEMVLKKLLLRSTTYYGYLGFRYRSPA